MAERRREKAHSRRVETGATPRVKGRTHLFNGPRHLSRREERSLSVKERRRVLQHAAVHRPLPLRIHLWHRQRLPAILPGQRRIEGFLRAFAKFAFESHGFVATKRNKQKRCECGCEPKLCRRNRTNEMNVTVVIRVLDAPASRERHVMFSLFARRSSAERQWRRGGIGIGGGSGIGRAAAMGGLHP